MSLAKKCDRCGKFYAIYNKKKDEKNANGFMFLNIDENQKYWSNSAKDLCQDCMESMYEWFNLPGIIK